MERRKVDILCVQETRWKGSKARSIGAGFKLFYYGVDSKRNGVGVVLKEEFVRNVLEVKRVSDRVMSLKLEIEGVMLNVVSGYAPQVGCELEEKERFWSELDEVMESIPTGERVVIGADFNRHVGEGNTGDEQVMGKFGVKERNLEGQMVVDFAKRMDMAVINTYFQKREEHRVTYKSGDLEKAYDRVPREELWYCMRKSGVAEKYLSTWGQQSRVMESVGKSKNQGEGVQDSGETGHAVWFRDSVTEEETGVRARGSRAEDVEGAGGNWATVGRRSRGGRRVRRQREKRKGKGRELADVMERRKVDILCVQETRWKGSKARSIGAGFKLFYYGVDSKRNGVGVVLKEEFVRNVLEVGCELEEKERFWSELDEVMESIPTGERVVIGADFNGHVGEGNTGDEEVMGKFGVKERNLEGQMVVDFAKRMDMGVVNTYFQKREEHRVTYKSGGRRTQIEKKTKWWKLKKEECSEVIRETGRKVLGVSSGRRKEDKETWWWNEEVQDSIQRKRLAKKKWDMDRTEENRQEYKELQRRVKREVSKAKQKAYEELYTRLDTREGEKDLYRLARQRDRDGKDVQQVRVIKDRDGRVLTSEESVQRRWKEYFEELMNEENEREKRVEGVNSVEQKVDKIRKDEVRKALKRMKSGKAVGPDDIPVEVWKCLGEAAVEFLANLFNRVLENLEKAYDRVPREELWYCMRKSGVAEKYVRVVQDMYERSRTVVRCAVVMDQLSEEVRQESPWTMMFADDIVICSESREQVEENLERWRFALERRGMKVSRSKTEYMCVNEREGSGTVRLQGEEVKKVQEFKYLGSTVQSNGECGKEVKKRVQAGWNGWRKVSGVLCDQKISARIKGKVYRTVVRPAMLYGLETVSLRKRQELELEVAELKMLRFSLGVTRLERIRNEYIRGTAHVGRLGDKVREARLRWFGHVQRRDMEVMFNKDQQRIIRNPSELKTINYTTIKAAKQTQSNRVTGFSQQLLNDCWTNVSKVISGD
ncbi:hypothetical protein QTP86_004518 [Hemibagrus guttatus]|nr:hypothetical protein QTP86_004518 [Hemibagrus guttatus]